MRIVNMTEGVPDPGTQPRKPAAGNRPAEVTVTPVPADPESAADQAITALYRRHYVCLVRLAALLVGDGDIAERVAQDAFVATHGVWHRLRDADEALSHLRRCVVSGSRSVLRQRIAAYRTGPKHTPGTRGAHQAATTQLQRSAVFSALQTLPPRQREALVLRFYLDLSEEQAASAMGISPGAVRRHTTRAMAMLPGVLKLEE